MLNAVKDTVGWTPYIIIGQICMNLLFSFSFKGMLLLFRFKKKTMKLLIFETAKNSQCFFFCQMTERSCL